MKNKIKELFNAETMIRIEVTEGITAITISTTEPHMTQKASKIFNDSKGFTVDHETLITTSITGSGDQLYRAEQMLRKVFKDLEGSLI